MILPTSFASAAKHYLAGAISASINGGVSGVAGILGIDAAAISGLPDVQVLNWKGMLAAFIGGFVIHGFMWLKAHPLPESYDTAAPFVITSKAPPSSPADTPPFPPAQP